MVPFEIDHFIPKHSFKGKNDALMTKYENLMYSCKKCNRAKWNQFKGDVFSSDCSNELFYDPTKVDYNTVFYRDEYGAISSDDPKGRDMISRLRLYRTLHILAWLCEELEIKKDRLKEKYEQESNTARREYYEKAYYAMLEHYNNFRNTFDASYQSEDLDDGAVRGIVEELISNCDEL
jgi:hypothetical protein